MFLEQYQCFWKFWFGLVVHWLLGLEFVYSFWSPFSSQEMSYLDYSTIDYNVELNNETSLEMRPESMYRNITTSTKMVLQAEPTDLRRNVYYYQIYYVYLNTIFASILPLLFLLYFNINTAKVRRLLERFAEHFPCCIFANQQYSSIIPYWFISGKGCLKILLNSWKQVSYSDTSIVHTHFFLQTIS